MRRSWRWSVASPASATALIEQTLDAGITLDIAYPNVPFTPPSNGDSWLKEDIIWGTGRVETKDGRNVVIGVLQLAVFSPKDGGDGEGLAFAETARDLFNRLDLAADVRFGAASGPVARFEENWRSLVVSVPFQVFETVT